MTFYGTRLAVNKLGMEFATKDKAAMKYKYNEKDERLSRLSRRVSELREWWSVADSHGPG